MCYDIRSKLKTQKERYEYWRHKNGGKVKSLDIFGNDIFHASGFSHPSLLIYTNQAPYEPVQSTWGLVPTTTSTWNHTLNARGETIFEKPSFRESARSKRCLIYVDGFYEHHHLKGKTYPYYIFPKDESPMVLASLWNEWTDKTSGELQSFPSIWQY